jgi:hypothetical protein
MAMEGADLALVAGGITAANELFFAPASGDGTLKDFNWRVIPATAVFSLLLFGLGQLSPDAAKGVGITALVSVLFTRVGKAPAPLENLANVLGYGDKKK